MNKRTVILTGLGLAAGVGVGLGVLYVLGKKRLTVTDPKAVDSADVGQKIAAGWTTVMTATFTPPPRGSMTTAGEDNVDGKGEPIVNNFNSAPTDADLAMAGIYANVTRKG